ncbi:hypothetical protein A8C32_09730 [Flavivirga aquatica]|uniref:DUF4296 domain-containing protein n=2 Tax=Flavivirga aquatica TaxID=1849968 RepID=A0A1E5TEI0_9FLAO|nr:hypothetical protein A8C32_09730 [Flavivirga aquatica]
MVMACNNQLKEPEKPKNLISKGKMVDILIDSKLIGFANSKNKKIMKEKGVNINTYVFSQHNIDSLQFALSNSYYAFHIKEYEEIYTKVADSLEKLKVEFKALEAKEWKEKTKREEDSLASLTKKDSLVNILPENKIKKIGDSIKSVSDK